MSSNNSKHLTSTTIPFYTFPICRNLPPLPSSGRGLGRGWLYEPHEFDFPKPQNHPHPSLPPPDGGRNRIADTAKRSSENYDLWNFRRPRSSSNHAKHSLRCHSHIKKRSSETHLSDDLFSFKNALPYPLACFLQKTCQCGGVEGDHQFFVGRHDQNGGCGTCRADDA